MLASVTPLQRHAGSLAAMTSSTDSSTVAGPGAVVASSDATSAADVSHCSIAIVSINYAPEMTGIAVYTTGMAEHLAQTGHRVTVFTAFPYYPQWHKRAQDEGAWFRRENANAVALRRSYLYVPRRPGVVHRIVHELSFVAGAALSYLLASRAAVTVVVSPPLFLGIPIALLARLKGSRVIFHVQDLQPDAAVDLGMIRQGRVARALFAIERWTYGLAHCVSAISPSMLRRIARKGVPTHKLLLFPNWANDDLVTPLPASESLRAEWGLGERFVVLYAGNMGVKQGLDALLDVAALLRDEPDIVFVLVGDGGEKPALTERAQALRLDNVVFHPLQPMERLPRLLACADVSVIPQKPGVTDIVLPSKLPNLMSSARPVVAMADADTELHRVIEESGCGAVVPPGDASAMAGALLQLRASPAERASRGEAGWRYARERLSRNSVLGGFERWLREWSGAPRRPGGAAS